MKVLHIIRKNDDRLAQEMIEHDRTTGDMAVLLIQDGVLSRLKVGGEIYASVNDVEARGITAPYKLIDYPEICKLIIEHDKVVVW